MAPPTPRRKSARWIWLFVPAVGVVSDANAQLLSDDVVGCEAHRLSATATDRTIRLNGQEHAQVNWPNLPASTYLVLAREIGADLSITATAQLTPKRTLPR